MKKLLIVLCSLSFTSIASANDFPAEQAEVESFLAAHTVSRVTNYCRTDILNCRSVVQYKKITTGALVNSFEDRFVASTDNRSVSFRGFFLEQADGTFNIYSQNLMSNDVNIDTVLPFNQAVTIAFNADNLPTLPLKFIISGTDQLVDDTLIYTATEATFNNDTPNDPSDDFVIPFQSQTFH